MKKEKNLDSCDCCDIVRDFKFSDYVLGVEKKYEISVQRTGFEKFKFSLEKGEVAPAVEWSEWRQRWEPLTPQPSKNKRIMAMFLEHCHEKEGRCPACMRDLTNDFHFECEASAFALRNGNFRVL